MITRVILLSLVFSLVSFLVVRALSPRLLRGWRQVVPYWLFVLGIHGAWLWVRAQGHGQTGDLGAAVQVIASSWTITTLACVFIGGPWALLRPRLEKLREKPVDLERRRFLGGAAVPAAALATGGGGSIAGLGPFTVRHEEIRVAGLPEALDGFRIGQITDVHIGDFVDPDFLHEAVAAMNEARCDLQVMTGDLIDDLAQFEATLDAMEANDAPHGMLCILGNHEIWRGRAEVIAGYQRRAPNGRLKLLVDESVRIDHRGTALQVVGVDYPIGAGRRGKHRLPKEERDAKMATMAERAWAQVPAGDPVLCLTHHPDFFPHAAKRGAALTLAGHTHGGQVAFLGFPLFRFAYDYMLGRYRKGESHLYVSGGTGHWLPWRVGVPTEVTILTLRRAEAGRAAVS
ncbi:metallophosphoesterase [Vulgatibacter sp.]|uniref:metallophosphoesterase n=1 Tax=Vulgatibacter sp. TaxID=1971226 RepID=UPI003568407E